MEHYVIFDIEILKAIPSSKEPVIEGIEYCGGWTDHQGMGISCIGAYDYYTDRYRVFCADNFAEFQAILTLPVTLVTFNGINFDNRVLAANGFAFDGEVKHYDILREVWAAAGLNPDVFNPRTHGGYGLDVCAGTNFGAGKTGNGALAPVEWQQGKIGSVIDYCLNDVRLTKMLFDLILSNDEFKHPKTGYPMKIRKPSEATL